MRAAALLLLLAACTPEERAQDLPRPFAEVAAELAARTDPPPPPLGHLGVERLRFGFVPFLRPEEMRSEFGRLVGYLSKRLGVPVEMVIPDTYDGLIAKVVAGEVDLAELTPLSYVHTKEKVPGLVLLATSISEGTRDYAGYIVTAADSDVRTVQDLRGMRFGYVSRHSTSGFLYARAHFIREGIDPERFFSDVLFLGNHQNVIDAVLSHVVGGGATFSGALIDLPPRASIGIRVLAKTGRIPSDAYCARPGLPAEVYRAVKQVLLSVSTRTSQGRKVLSMKQALNGFIRASDSDYDSVRTMERLTRRQP